jgi:hypothetical protein
MIPGVEKIEGNPRTKELKVSVVGEGLSGEIITTMKQIGYPVEG